MNFVSPMQSFITHYLRLPWSKEKKPQTVKVSLHKVLSQYALHFQGKDQILVAVKEIAM